MKTIKSLLVILLTMLGGSCSTKTQNHPTSAITVLIDKTDSLKVHPEPEDFRLLFGKDIYQGWLLRFVDIDNTSLSPLHEFKLSSSTRRATPKKVRREQFGRFAHEVQDYFEGQAFDKVTSLNRSIIFEKLTREIEHLHKSKADNKVLFLYSDGYELDSYSFYDPATLKQLRVNPETMAKELLPLKQSDYSDIIVYWIYQSKSYQENQRYRLIRDFLDQSLSGYGITLITRAETPTQISSTSTQITSP